MNGATAEPWLSTISPPNSAIITMIGKSQNFLRTRRNIHNSDKKDISSLRQNWLRIVSGAGPGGVRSIQ